MTTGSTSEQGCELEIREAAPGDNASLLDLARCCPMRAAVSLAIERDPDFFALSRARGQSRTLIAESLGHAVGCITLSRRPAWVGGERAEVACLADLKIAPAHRGRGLGTRLIGAMLEGETSRPPVPLLATIAAGNRPAELLAGHCSPVVGLTGTSVMTCLQLFGASAPREQGFEIGRARAGDETELAVFLDTVHRERQFAPVFAAGGLAGILSRSPGLSIDDHFVARQDGRIIAAVALWDQSSFKRIRVISVTPWLRAAFMVLAAAARVFPVPARPRIGERVRLAFLRHPAHAPGAEAALAALLRTATHHAVANGHHFAVLTVAENDPIKGCAGGIPRLTYRYRQFVGVTSPRAEPASLHVRVAFDDAALA